MREIKFRVWIPSLKQMIDSGLIKGIEIMNKEIKNLIKDFKKNFKEDFVWEEAEIWLESEIEELIKSIIPKKISDTKTEKEIKDFPKRLDDEGKQRIRAKDYGWNLCVKQILRTKPNL